MGKRGPLSDPGKAATRPGRAPRSRPTIAVLGGGKVAAPETLGTAGRAFWDRWVTVPWITAADHGPLERLCEIYDQLDEYGGIVDREGAVVPGSKMQPVAHPLLPFIDRARSAADRLEIELGLTPMARQRMHLKLEPEPARVTPTTDTYAHLRVDPRDRLRPEPAS